MSSSRRRGEEGSGSGSGGYRRVRIDDLLNPISTPSPGHGQGRGQSRVRSRGASSSTSSGSRTIKCSYCNRQFSSREELTTHRMQSHPTSFICTICNSSFFDKGNLNKHVSRVCFRNNLSQLTQQQIRSVHEKQRPFECDYCNSSFAFSDGLKRHIRMVHLNDRPFSCSYCTLAFKQRAHLIKHVAARHPEHRAGSSSSGGR